jgi:hypothetical protein
VSLGQHCALDRFVSRPSQVLLSITGNLIFHFSDLRVNQDLSAPDSIGVGKGDGAPSSVGVRSERVEIPQNKYSDSQ